MKSIMGRKMGMTEVFAADGTMYPVTVIEVLPNVIVGKKTIEKDGYENTDPNNTMEKISWAGAQFDQDGVLTNYRDFVEKLVE